MSYSHGPGQPSHSHGPATQQTHVQMSPPDPAVLQAIEADFKPVSLKLGDPSATQALCSTHGLPTCLECGLDFAYLNRLSSVLHQNPQLNCPPPPNVIQPNRSQAVTKTKEEGNKSLFKAGKHAQAIQMYTMAASVAAGRPHWEPAGLVKEEVSIVICNRSAAHSAAGDYLSALADAEFVLMHKRNWSKGHFRKAKALVGLGRLEDARDAIALGLQFEPTNAEMNAFLNEIETMIKVQNGKQSSQASQNTPTVMATAS